MEAGTVSTPELIAKKIGAVRHQGRPVRGRPAHPTWSGPEAIADIADSYDLNLRNGMESGGGPTGRGARARIRAGQDGGGCDAVQDVDDEPDIDFGSP